MHSVILQADFSFHVGIMHMNWETMSSSALPVLHSVSTRSAKPKFILGSTQLIHTQVWSFFKLWIIATYCRSVCHVGILWCEAAMIFRVQS